MYTVLRAVSVDSIVIYWLMELHSPGKGVYQFVCLPAVYRVSHAAFIFTREVSLLALLGLCLINCHSCLFTANIAKLHQMITSRRS